MRKLLYKSGAGIGLALLSSTAFAATQEELLGMLLGQIQMYVLIAFVIIVIAGVYFMKSRDKHQTPLNKVFEGGRAIHSVGPDASITECVRLMTAGKIGARDGHGRCTADRHFHRAGCAKQSAGWQP